MKRLLAAAALILLAQSTAPAAGFEVASIKPALPGTAGRSLSHPSGSRLTTSNASLKMLVMLAYQVMPVQLWGGPPWLDGDGFDIEARGADPKATPSQFREMIQGLLADRFQLKVHRETRNLPVYQLVVARNGAKLVESKSGDAEVGARIEGPGQMTGVTATMAMLASALTRPLQQIVVDRTGLSGAYDFGLRYSLDQSLPGPGEEVARPGSDGPSIFTALQEQLGLVLKPGKGPVEVVVIDHAEKPSEN